MSFLSNILKGVGIAGAPFTGGASLALTGMDLAGSILGGMGEGAAAERGNANNLALQQDRNALSAYQTRQMAQNQLLQMQERAALDRADLGMKAPSTRTSQLIRGSLLQNLKPLSITPTSSKVKIPQLSGGLSPSALSAMARSGGGELQKQALLALLTKSDIPAQLDYSKALMDAPTPTAMKQPGKLETIAGIASPILRGVSAFGNAAAKTRTTPPIIGDTSLGGRSFGNVRFGN